jgi:homoserine O-acetyltransferase
MNMEALPGHRLTLEAPLPLDCGVELAPVSIAYQTYGTLNAERSNAILICHALTGDQFVADRHPITGKPGWWQAMVGPGKVFDTDRYFLICSNVLGGCMGTTGPADLNPATGKVWGLDFPVITIGDMVRAQVRLIDHLGIEKLFCVAGGSMGGMQVLEWAARYPERMRAAVPIATAARHSAQNIAFHEVGRQAITADPEWRDGAYASENTRPQRGLAVARMAAHITYLSEAALHRKFGRNLQRGSLTFGFDADFQVESYLRHQGLSFTERFDANSYLYITRAMDYFDLAADHGGLLAQAFAGTRVHFCVISFSSDWLFPTSESRAVVKALNSVAANVSFVEVESDKGHDAFLLDEPDFHATSPRWWRQARACSISVRATGPCSIICIARSRSTGAASNCRWKGCARRWRRACR